MNACAICGRPTETLRCDEHLSTYVPAGPVISAFHECEKFVKAIIGSFGSGKSAACCFDLYFNAMMQPKQRDGKRRSRYAVARGCFDDKTEILTEENGWVLFPDLLETDKVAMLENGKTVFVKPYNHCVWPYVGEMIKFESEGINFSVTPEHKMYVSRRNQRRAEGWMPYELVKAEDCYGKSNMKVSRHAEWDGVDCGLSEDMFEWLGYWYAEGYTSLTGGRHYCVITTKSDLEYAENLFDKAGLPFSRNSRGDKAFNLRLRVTPETKPLIAELDSYGKSCIHLSVPAKWKNAPTEHIRRFIKGFIVGDGAHRTKDNTVCAYTSSSKLADDLQEMALKAGYVVNLNKHKARDHMVINGVVTKQNADPITLTFLGKGKYTPGLQARNRYKGWHKEMYHGNVYCLEVPTHVIYVRREGRGFWCSQTYRELSDTTIKTWLDWFGEFGTLKVSDSSFLLEHGDVEMEVLFRALDKPEDVKKLLSAEYTGAWINEAKEVPKAIFDGLTGRVGRYPSPRDGGCVEHRVIMDTNPPDEDSWLYKLFEVDYYKDSQIAEEYELFKQPPGGVKVDGRWEDNWGQVEGIPQAENIQNLKKGYYRRMAVGKDPEWIKVYVEGKYGFVQDGRPVFSQYNDQLHCQEFDADPELPLYLGFDAGLTPACAIAQLSKRGQLRILDELNAKDMGMYQFARDAVKPHLAKFYPNYKINQEAWADPAHTRGEAGEQTAIGMLNDLYIAESDHADGIVQMPLNMPFTTVPAPGGNTLAPRLDAVNQYLTRLIDGAPAFLLHPRCAMLRKGFGGRYRFERVQVSGTEDRFKELPKKNVYSHCFIGETLVSTALGKVRIDSLKIGDLVTTPIGAKRVTAVMDRLAAVGEVKFKAASLICTPEHPISTLQGFIHAEAILYDDIILSDDGFTQLKEGFISREVPETVYDITVEDAHCFYANGILVHNCQDAVQNLCKGTLGETDAEDEDFDYYDEPSTLSFSGS